MKINIKAAVPLGTALTACDFLAEKSGLSKSRIKDAMNKGAVWLKRKRGGLKRLRKATARLSPGDMIELYYDEQLLAIKPAQARCIKDTEQYSVWFKPSGLMAQGTQYGDHCSLLRQVEVSTAPPRQAYLVHRLDREASGLMLVAHTSKAAARLSALFSENRIVKEYRIEVLGDLKSRGKQGIIELPLDGKTALTTYTVMSYKPETNTTIADVVIKTGRLHQIRRHFEMLGFPVIGDPKYGKGNKNKEGMRLEAVSLSFRCPFSHRDVEFRLPGSPSDQSIPRQARTS